MAKITGLKNPVITGPARVFDDAFSRIFITCGMPPAWCRSTARYLPLGLRSHSTGTRWRMRSKSSMDQGTPAGLAIARKCR